MQWRSVGLAVVRWWFVAVDPSSSSPCGTTVEIAPCGGNIISNHTSYENLQTSKDNDLGNRTLQPGEHYKWHFRPNIGRTTLFFCTFWWNSKTKSFVVFDVKHIAESCNTQFIFGYQKCFWYVMEDGFWFNNFFPETKFLKDGKNRSRTEMYVVSRTCKDGTVLESAKGKLTQNSCV
ncbi:hypothetical protein RJ639_019919 [Escallonia herrerae]|uniref:S-protein homolog n=1 Tax=Escallonia herrerae TaxID=1293975 RepID=A0AA88V7A7_9ASTE|nr:hypothetical protein RJ639_019919 [Escallonia herrerae]